MEQITGGPQKDYCQLTKVGSKNFMIKAFFGNIIMTLKVMCGRNTEPNTTSSWVLGQALAELWKS
uniref:ORF64c n=1 Tax=Pinus koraiensis TaxID=88728 RepID=Q85WW9_PINKO|nr:ORF64c [Pinus koraiensis]